jgi:hypothetical protein
MAVYAGSGDPMNHASTLGQAENGGDVGEAIGALSKVETGAMENSTAFVNHMVCAGGPK